MKTNQVLFILALFAVFCNSLSATVNYKEFMWEEATIIPAEFRNEYWLEFWFLPSNPKYGFACSMDGAFAKTTDSGKTWHASIIQRSFHAESVHFADTNIGFVSGPSTVYKTVDGGATWNMLILPRLGAPTSTIWGHFLTDKNNVWVAGGRCITGNQIIYKSTDGGDNWSWWDTVIENTAFTDITMFDKDGLGYAVSSGFLWRTLNGGDTWQILNETPPINWQHWQAPFLSNPTQYNWHEDIAIFNNRSVLIPMSAGCSGGGSGGREGALGFSSDLGRNWRTFMTRGSMFGTFLLNDSTGWGAGYNQEIYWTRDYGNTWNLMNCGIPYGMDLDDLWFINDTVGFVGGNGGIYRLVRRNFNVTVLGDPLKCKYDSVELTVDRNFSRYEWFEIRENGDTVIFASQKNIFIENGKYFVRGHISNCGYVDSEIFTVSIFPSPTVEIKTDGNFCVGDTLKIWVEKPANITDFYWLVNSENIFYQDTIFIENIQAGSLEILFIYEDLFLLILEDSFYCNDTVKYEINIYDRVKPILAGESSFCVNDSRIIKLVNANVFTENIWYKDNLEVARNISELTVSEAGTYFVIASINQLCADSSDILEITVRDEFNVLDFSENEIPFFVDSVNFGRQNSRYFKVRNNGTQEFILTHIYFAQKFAFTAPTSQFPIIIPPNETKEVLIFYTPTNINEQNDTIYFQDNCSMHRIILSGFGKRNIDSAITVCDVEIKIETRSINQKRIFTVGSIMPNPVGTKGKISYVVETQSIASLPQYSNITVQLYDVIGNEIKTQFIKNINQITKTDESEIESGEIIIDTQHLKSGVYFLRINLDDTNYLLIMTK